MSVIHLPSTPASLERESGRHIRISHESISAFVGILEWAAVSLGGLFSASLCQVLLGVYLQDMDVALGVGVTAASLYVLLSAKLGLYKIPYLLAPERAIPKVSLAWISVVALLVAILFMLKVSTTFSRSSILTFSVLALVFLTGGRLFVAMLARKLLSANVIAGRPAVIIGEACELNRWKAADLMVHFGVIETARVAVFSDDLSWNDSFNSQRLERAIELSRATKAEEFVIAVRWTRSKLLETVRNSLSSSPLRVRLAPDEFMCSVVAQRSPSGVPLIPSVDLQRAPMTAWEQFVKRCVDIALAFTGIMAVLPLLIFVAAAVKLDSSGPVFFRQRRNGFNGQPFAIYKFRTMHVMEDGPEFIQAKRNDSRVTRIGRILRRTSIDELPQLFNVLMGDMSLIGPRPHALAHDDKFKHQISNYAFRHHVKPGITGWAQINGHRGETNGVSAMHQRVEFDIWYINNWSLSLDFLILLRTVGALLKNDAY